LTLAPLRPQAAVASGKSVLLIVRSERGWHEESIEQSGPRGVPGAPDPAKMTPHRAKKTPTPVDTGHTA
jgi:hypothetical protein